MKTVESKETVAESTDLKDNVATAQSALVTAMERIDPFLRFLTKATGKTSVPLKLLDKVLPKSKADAATIAGAAADTDDKPQDNNEILLELTHRGVLNYNQSKQTIGFPLPPSPTNSKDSATTKKKSSKGSSSSSSSSSPLVASSISKLQKPPAKMIGKGLHSSTEPASKRRMKVLKWSLECVPAWICREEISLDDTEHESEPRNAADDNCGKPKAKGTRNNKKRSCSNESESNTPDDEPEKQLGYPDITETDERNDACEERRAAYRALDGLLSGWGTSKEKKDAATIDENSLDGTSSSKQGKKQWLPCQAAYAGTHPGRVARYESLSKETLAKIQPEIMQLFDLDVGDNRGQFGNKKKRLFLHQAQAIESAMNNSHTVVQTATGSGKSLCFLLPVLAKAMSSLKQQHSHGGAAAILLFPTKALAQDQYSKINALLEKLSNNNDDGTDSNRPLRAGVIDGDTPHQKRDDIATQCQIILTNPDTLHAALLPNWKKKSAYQNLLSRVATVVVDEAHVYEGAFGAHIAMVLARLKRVIRVASSSSNAPTTNSESDTSAASPLFIACSATMLHPEEHFRLLCPIGKDEKICVLTPREDGSPCAPKHFFAFNPPILDVNGNSTESVFMKMPKKQTDESKEDSDLIADGVSVVDAAKNDDSLDAKTVVNIQIGRRRKKRRRLDFGDNQSPDREPQQHLTNLFTKRRHAADETAVLLAKAITNGVRTIAFCKTRMLVEWVYERTLAILNSNPDTAELTSKVESYRGGYTAEIRRSIEKRLFQRKLMAVVGTCALELGVDVGGVDLTLHTGYPGSISSLLQQSGRAGRNKGSDVPSCAIMVCFSSPSEQHIWKNPTSLLSRGVNAPPTLPINGTVMQGHLLCAGEEFPLTNDRPVSCLLNEFGTHNNCPSDCELLGPEDVYQESIDFLLSKGLISKKKVSVMSGNAGGVKKLDVYVTHPVVKSPWKRVNLRSIEPVSYSIVDLSHNLQGGKTDRIHDPRVVLDTIPYSRVFYHAFPGSIVMHRGRKYRIESMENPPPFVGGASFGCAGCNLMAFAKPTTKQYSTQALSINQITVVKQMGHAELTVDSIVSAQQSSASDSKGEGYDEGEGEQQQQPKKLSVTSTVAGHGIVTAKRTVHGYKKLSHVNRKELSRTTISLPPMEYDTYAFWLDADAAYLRDLVLNFDGGVHALSHAMVAVAPCFVACTNSDIDCDHSTYETTRILLYDRRAGGSGVASQLYHFIIDALQAAVNLLEECTSCYSIKGYDGGCPACLQSVSCDNFHTDLSRSAGIRVGKHLIERLKKSNLNSQKEAMGETSTESAKDGSNKSKKLIQTKLSGIQGSIKPTNILIGRASWSPQKERDRFAQVDEE